MKLILAFLVVCLTMGAQKRPLTIKDFDTWRAITSQQISADGRYVAYGLFPQVGDGEVVIRELATGRELREPAGERPPARPADEDEEEPRTTQPSVKIEFSADGKFVVFSTFPARAALQRARLEKKKTEEMPKNGLVVLELTSGKAVRIENVKSFQLPSDGAGWLAWQKDAPKATDLVLRNLADGTERTFAAVTEYSFSKDAQSLVYATADGIHAATPGAEPRPLASGKAKYTKLTWDDPQTQLAFLAGREDQAAKQTNFRLYHWDRKGAAAAELDATCDLGFRMSDTGALRFSRHGGELFYGCALPRRANKEIPPEERVVADLWHWKDGNVPTMQKARASRERNRTYGAVWHFDRGAGLQLADTRMAEISLSDDGRMGVGADNRAYRPLREFDRAYADYYLVNTATGFRRLALTKSAWAPSISPDGHYLLYYDGRNWNSLHTASGQKRNLTGNLNVAFYNEDDDRPAAPSAYGSAGWTRDGKLVLLYDRYDVWQLSPDGSVAKNRTDSLGRREKLIFRVVRPDASPENRYLDPAKPLLLRAESEVTRDSGFWRDRLDVDAPPEKLMMAAKSFSTPVKAKKTETLLLTASAFTEFPDLLVSGPDFRELRKASDANPQQREFAWGTAELMRFRNTDGIPLSAVLVKPANFDATRKYPLMVWIYERLSQTLHSYSVPQPNHRVNPSFYASNGYVVLMPDIIYTAGYPGESALKCVLPAVDAVAGMGFVDEKAIGIWGHSWGGYETAYLITRTNRFRAASAGAPVSNMTSAYQGIRWGSGLPRQFQYERDQSRIGGSLWEYPMRFLENSPVFQADRVRTPLLMLHNDADDAVPWYQGIEFFLALRRLGREVYLFNYNGEPHHLHKRPNQKDYTMKLFEFFNHHLRGAPKPDWMERGIPYLERERAAARSCPLRRSAPVPAGHRLQARPDRASDHGRARLSPGGRSTGAHPRKAAAGAGGGPLHRLRDPVW